MQFHLYMIHTFALSRSKAMSRLQFRALTKDADIDGFLEHFKRYVNIKLPESYARSGTVVGAFDGDDMIGGYMLVARGPYRALAFVPDEVKEQVSILKNASSTDFIEVNGFWVKENYRGSAKSAEIWLDIRRNVLATKASHLLLFYNAKAKGLGQMYQDYMKPETIYRGAPASNQGVTTAHAEITVGMVSRLNMRLAFYRALGKIMARKLLSYATPSEDMPHRVGPDRG
jgi:hypothetical protein